MRASLALIFPLVPVFAAFPVVPVFPLLDSVGETGVFLLGDRVLSDGEDGWLGNVGVVITEMVLERLERKELFLGAGTTGAGLALN